jgi:uncharacterized protein YjiS (DUF1127 family)
MHGINYIRLNDEWPCGITLPWSRPFEASQSKGNQNMAFFSLEHASDPRHLSLVSSLAGLRARAVASWQRHRAERVLESLSYDTLKDIGFPSVDMARKDTQAK